jgi:hypothetical protein
MRNFLKGQRVTVKCVFRGVDIEGDAVGGFCLKPPPVGIVERVRRDGGAWIALDTREDKWVQCGVYPFPSGDPRERHVLAFPEDCDLVPR